MISDLHDLISGTNKHGRGPVAFLIADRISVRRSNHAIIVRAVTLHFRFRIPALLDSRTWRHGNVSSTIVKIQYIFVIFSKVRTRLERDGGIRHRRFDRKREQKPKKHEESMPKTTFFACGATLGLDISPFVSLFSFVVTNSTLTLV